VADNEVLGELLEDGKPLRVQCELDFRRFPPIPRATLLAMAPVCKGVLGQTRLRKVAEALRGRLGLASG